MQNVPQQTTTPTLGAQQPVTAAAPPALTTQSAIPTPPEFQFPSGGQTWGQKYGPGIMSMASGLGALFGSSGGMGDAIGGAQNVYQNYLNQAMAQLKQQQAAGMGYIQPYMQAGGQGLQAYLGSLGLQGGGAQQTAVDRFQASPGYQFALQQGLQSVQRGMGAGGLTGSGAEMRALQQTGQGMAQQEYGQYQQRLAGLAGMGQQAAQFGAGMGQQYGQSIAGLYGTMGSAQAQAEMAQAQAEAAQQSGIGAGIGGIVGGLISLI